MAQRSNAKHAKHSHDEQREPSGKMKRHLKMLLSLSKFSMAVCSSDRRHHIHLILFAFLCHTVFVVVRYNLQSAARVSLVFTSAHLPTHGNQCKRTCIQTNCKQIQARTNSFPFEMHNMKKSKHKVQHYRTNLSSFAERACTIAIVGGGFSKCIDWQTKLAI